MNSPIIQCRPVISNDPDAVVGLSANGRISIGVNLEFPGLLHRSVHAEQFMVASVAVRINYVVPAAPSAITDSSPKRSVAPMRSRSSSPPPSNPMRRWPSANLMPHRFSLDDLLGKEAPLLLEPKDNGLALGLDPEDGGRIGHCNGDSRGVANWDELKRSALDAANRAHAPYSGCPSGAAVMDSKGRVFCGSYVESAAYNPSLMPLQAALVAYVATSGGGLYEEIVAAALVEKEGALVGQEATAKMVLRSVAPECEFRTFRCLGLDGKKNPTKKTAYDHHYHH